MLFNPYQEKPPLLPGTNIVEDSWDRWGLLGYRFEDPIRVERYWTVRRLYGFGIGHRKELRLRVEDDFGFISFVRQLDFEVLCGLGAPGKVCPWTSTLYPYVNDEDSGWVGLFASSEDFDDDLFERELMARYSLNENGQPTRDPMAPLPPMELHRLLHADGADYIQHDLFLYDCDPRTGQSPDMRRNTVRKRWVKNEKRKVTWEHPWTWNQPT